TEGTPGFDFLGFHIRQYPAGKTHSGKDCRGRLHGFKTLIKPSQTAIRRHVAKLRKTIDHHKHATQETLIQALNPQIVGWSNYYAHVPSARVFQTGVLGVSRGKCAVSYNWLYIKWLQWPVDRCDATDFAVQYEYTPLSG